MVKIGIIGGSGLDNPELLEDLGRELRKPLKKEVRVKR